MKVKCDEPLSSLAVSFNMRHYIQERDHDIELPLDGGGGRSKPLAHATFTDLVHFLLRMEGPKRKDAKRVKKVVAVGPGGAPVPGGGGAPVAAMTWEEEMEAGAYTRSHFSST